VNLITRKRALATLTLAGASALVLAGCGAAPEEGGGEETVDYLACAVSDEGNWNDKSFNQAAYEGLLKAEDELGIEIQGLESAAIDDFQDNLTAMVDAGCDVIFAVGFNFSLNNVIFDFADANPEAKIVWLDGWNQGQTNLKPITYKMQESSYLAGYLAADYSTTKVIGTYGGGDFTAVTDFMDGYYYGAQAWAADNGVPVTVLGRDPVAKTGSFTDPTVEGGGFADTEGAKAISAAQIAEGADVIFPVAGGLFASTAEAIADSGKDVVMLGVDKDIALTSPDYADITLTSAEKRMTQAVFDVISELMDGGEFTIDPYVGTLANDGTGLSPFYDFEGKLSDTIVDKLAELQAGIIDGSIDPLAAP